MDPAVSKFVDSIACGALSGTCTDFFSRANINAVHKSIMEAVQEQLGYCIEQQSEQQLLLLMRSMWVRHGALAGVGGTNCKVVVTAVGIIKTNVEMHETATRFLYRNPEPLSYGETTNVRGTKLS